MTEDEYIEKKNVQEDLVYNLIYLNKTRLKFKIM